jgi:hypothetical protein
MNCKTCGVQNVEYATTCYSCGKPLGGGVLGALPSIPSAPSMPSTHSTPSPASRSPSLSVSGATARAAANGLNPLMRFAFLAVVLFLFFRQPIGAILETLKSAKFEPREVSSESSPPADSAPAEAPPDAPAAAPAPPAEEEVASDLPPPDLGPEINGFHLKSFQWNLPEGTSEVHFGDVVRGQSQIIGFDVSKDNRIDVTMRFTFRDPKGKVVEQGDPNRLDQPVESDTLYSTFDYTIPAKGPAGDYDLEIRVDDAVSGRSAAFHNAIKAVR